MKWQYTVERLAFFLIILIVQLVPSGIHAQPVNVGRDVNVNESARDENIDGAVETIIEVNPLNPKHLVIKANTAHFLYYSLDGGINWHHLDVQFPVSGFLTDPSLAFDDNGTLYAAMGSEDPGIQSIGICRFEHGAFDITPIPYTCTVNPGTAIQKWHIGAGPAPGGASQNVYVAYQGPGFSDISVTYSTDGGKSFSPSMFNPIGNGHFPRPVVAANGDVFVAWYQSNGDIMVARSTDGGQSFAPAVRAASARFLRLTTVPPQPQRGIFTGPVIDTDRSGGPYHGSVYITYVDEGVNLGNDYDIFVVSNDGDGMNWSTPTRVNADIGAATQFLPWLDVDQKTGTLSVIWYDPRNDPANVKVRAYLATSIDGGQTFGPNVPVADGESDEADRSNYLTSSFDYAEYIGVAIDGCVAHTAWSDNHMTHARADGFFRRNPDPSETLILNGVTWTFVDRPPNDYETQIAGCTPAGCQPGDKSTTLARLIADLNASSDPKLTAAEYTRSDDVLTIQATTPGPSGGLFTLDTSTIDGFINIKDIGGTYGYRFVPRLEILLNTKTDQIPVPCTPGDEMLVVDGLASPRGAGKVLRYHRASGAFREEFIANCAEVAPLGDCSAEPGAAENPSDMIFGPDNKLYVADVPISSFGFEPTGIAVKRYDGPSGVFDELFDPHAAFVRYGDGGLEQVGGLVFGPDSNLYVSDFFTGAVLRYHGQTGEFLDTYIAVSSLLEPGKLLFGPDGNLYVIELGGNRIVSFQGPFGDNPGAPLPDFIVSGAGFNQLVSAVFGPDGQIFVATGNSTTGYSLGRYQGPFDSNPGAFIDSIAFPASTVLSSSAGLTVGPGRSLYVSDRGVEGGVLRVYPDTGTIHRIAYVGQPGALLLTSVPAIAATLGDFNGDGCVDRAGDLMALINAVRNRLQDARFDLNGDGSVTIADARKLTLLFSESSNGDACMP